MSTVVAVYISGPQIKRLRVLKGWSQRELAKETGLSQSTIVLLERESKNEHFHPQTLTKLAHGLGVEPEELIQED